MNKVVVALLCTFTVAHLKVVKHIPSYVKFKRLPDTHVVLKEQINEKITYIAAMIDRQHVKFIDHLKSIANRKIRKTENEIMKFIKHYMTNVIKTILPDLRVLVAMTDNREQSAFEVNKHFAEDHVDPMLQAIYGVENNHPKFFNSLKKKIAESAQEQIRRM